MSWPARGEEATMRVIFSLRIQDCRICTCSGPTYFCILAAILGATRNTLPPRRLVTAGLCCRKTSEQPADRCACSCSCCWIDMAFAHSERTAAAKRRLREKFRRRRVNLFRKADQLSKIADALVYVVVVRNDLCYIYNSAGKDSKPPTLV